MKMNRRDFFRTVLNASAVAVGSYGINSAVNGIKITNDFFTAKPRKFTENSIQFSDEELLYPDKFSESISEKIKDMDVSRIKKMNFNIDDVSFGDFEYKLLGVNHNIDNFNFHMKEISNLIKGSQFVISENVNKNYASSSYFSQITRLCELHKKPVIGLDNGTNLATQVQTGVGTLGSLALSVGALSFIGATSRRKMLKSLGLGALGFYAASGSLFNNFYLRDLGSHKMPNHVLFSHDLDHRNVEITHRMSYLKSLMEKKDVGDFSDGYVLATFGSVHTEGIKRYYDRPDELVLRKSIYDKTYGLIDDDRIRYNFFNDGWKYISLKE